MDVRRPRTRRRLFAAVLLITGAVLGAVLWLSGGGNSTPVVNPTPSAPVETTQEPESTTPPPATPSPTPSGVQGHRAPNLTGIVTGRCETDTYSVTCRIDATVFADSDGRAQLQKGGSQYLLVTCSATCVASNVTKFELPCIAAGGSNVYCADAPDDRRGHYRQLMDQRRECEPLNGLIECKPQAGTYAFETQLYVGGWPAELAFVNGKVGIYAVAAPSKSAIQAVSNCTYSTTGKIQCRPWGGSSGTEASATVTCAAEDGVICGPFKSDEPSISVYCPGSDTAVACSLTQNEWFANRLDCKDRVPNVPGWRACTLARTD